jgi:cell wall-associated NlpC family hydrolase
LKNLSGFSAPVLRPAQTSAAVVVGFIPCLRGRALLALCCALGVSACAVLPKDEGSNRPRPAAVEPPVTRNAPPPPAEQGSEPAPQPVAPEPLLPSAAADDAADIVMHALGLLGVPYRWGGTDPRRGLDCSGLVVHVFQSVRGQALPRRAVDLSRAGEPVARHRLSAGDLVFFNTLGYANSHVAIYIGDGQFVHAPARRGVVRIEALDETYWRTRYNGARRISPSVAEFSAPPSMMNSAERAPGR